MTMIQSLDNLEEGSIILTQQGHDIVLEINRLLAISAFSDLALFEIKGHVENYLNLNESPLDVREDLMIPAYPSGVFTEIKKSGNIVNDYSFPTHPVDMSPGKPNSDSIPDDHYSSFPVHPIDVSFEGASGSPIIDDQGHVAGILSFMSESNSNILNSIKTSYLREFINGHIGTKCVLPIEEDTTYNSESIPKAPEYQFCIRKEVNNIVTSYGKGSPFSEIMLKKIIIPVLLLSLPPNSLHTSTNTKTP